MMNNFTRCIGFAIACSTILIDQVTKILAKTFIKNYGIRVNSFLSFTYSENTGAAWSMFRGHPLILAMLGVISMVILGLAHKQFETHFQKILAAMVFGGIFGNTLDRIFRGYVIDFIDVDLKFYHWPVFNIADGIICASIVILLFTFQRKAQKAK
ncbi:MAG: signal peptidase II [Puniceicoccales bacterium]|jgi:signal peptidase II|nr:signal peptidase II [Puniceicoccales bacterium]